MLELRSQSGADLIRNDNAKLVTGISLICVLSESIFMNLVFFMRRWPKVGLTIAAVTALCACSKPQAPDEPIRSVKVITIGAQPLSATLEYAAEVRARAESRLGFRVGGKVTARPVEVGQRVKAGQVLAQLDPQDLKLGLDIARAQVAAARANLDLAAADFKRFQLLKEQNFISGAELEKRGSVFKAAQAQWDQAQSQLSAQSNQAGYATLVADVPGVVTAVLAERAQVVAAGAPVVQLAQDGARDAVFAVPEDKVAGIKVGSNVVVRAWNGGEQVPAVVREIAASADPATRTFTVKVALPLNRDFALGSTLTVQPASLQLAGIAVIKLPTSALFQEGLGTAVWVLDKATMTVKLQSIQVATVDGNDVVVASGLQPGLLVVSTGVHVLAPGQKVTIYKEALSSGLVGQAQTAPSGVSGETSTLSASGASAVASAPKK